MNSLSQAYDQSLKVLWKWKLVLNMRKTAKHLPTLSVVMVDKEEHLGQKHVSISIHALFST